MATRRRYTKIRQKNHTYKNNTTKNTKRNRKITTTRSRKRSTTRSRTINRNTRKNNISHQVGGLRYFPTSPAKTRWGKRIEKLVIQKMMSQGDNTHHLNMVLALPQSEANDIPARFYTDPSVGVQTNISIKSKKFMPVGKVTIDTGYPINVLDALREPHPYHMIFVSYTSSGHHMKVDSIMRLNLKKLFHPIFVDFTTAEKDNLYKDIKKISELIKSKQDDTRANNMCKVVNTKMSAKSENKNIEWKVNPKISSSNHRLQSSLGINFDNKYVKSCIIEDDLSFSLSSAESGEDVSSEQWKIPVRETPTERRERQARYAADFLHVPVPHVTPTPVQSLLSSKGVKPVKLERGAFVETSYNTPKQGVAKQSRHPSLNVNIVQPKKPRPRPLLSPPPPPPPQPQPPPPPPSQPPQQEQTLQRQFTGAVRSRYTPQRPGFFDVLPATSGTSLPESRSLGASAGVISQTPRPPWR